MMLFYIFLPSLPLSRWKALARRPQDEILEVGPALKPRVFMVLAPYRFASEGFWEFPEKLENAFSRRLFGWLGLLTVL